MPETKNSRITLITGANRGLGYEAARRLSAAGQTVYIGARNETRGRAAATALGVDFVQLDVTDDSSVAAAAAELERREQRIDVLINNAGIPGARRDVAELSASDADEVFGTNVVGTVRVTNAFIPLLRRSSSPVIVNVSSGMGSFAVTQNFDRIESGVGLPLYSASKAAVTMLTTEYAKLLPEMRVNAVDPGYTATDFNHKSGSQTVSEGTDAMVSLASVKADGPTGTFTDRDGTVEW